MISLLWAVKETFVRYVGDHGSITTVPPACTDREGYVFAGASTSDEVWRFEGRIDFEAHAGLLGAVIADPWLHREPGGCYLSVAGTGPTRSLGDRLRLVELPELSTEDPIPFETRATLAAEGAVLFDFRYPADTEMAPIRIE
ncbi:HtaA domain-containing protein [Nocardia sp. NPDC050378]|uniref:HtaA domain-containing protein n=1 Tax=Nocardia sp. NPDC050378 TaxID=3155400 RepID=UPI0033CB175B